MSLGSCNLKQDTATYLLKHPNSKALTTPNDDENMEQLELSLTADRNAKCTIILEDSWVNSYKSKLLPYDPIIVPFVIYPNDLKTYVQRKHACGYL